MTTTRPLIALSGLTGMLALASCGDNADDNYPNNSVDVVIPYDAGGNLDALARPVVQCMEDELGERFLINNQPGSGGTIGTQVVAQADADGYTIGFTSVSPLAIAPEFMEAVDYELDDFENLGFANSPPMAIIVNPDSGINTLDDAIEQAQVEQLSAATPGADSMQSLWIDGFNEEYGTRFEEIPTDSATEITRGVAAGDYDVGFPTTSQDLLERVESGDVELLVHGSTADYEHFGADATAIEETDYADLRPASMLSASLVTPSGIPENVADTLGSTFQECMTDDAVRDDIGEEMLSPDFIDGDTAMSEYAELRDSINGS